MTSDERPDSGAPDAPEQTAPDHAAQVRAVLAEAWENEPPERPREHDLILDLDGFEGPLDVLLTLARHQKVDLHKISILQLAEQYLAFITGARQLRLEIAADYLVMAAWLAYMKSRLLLPEPEEDEEPSGEEMAEALAFRLRRLEAMREASARILRRPRLGLEVFSRGAPEGVEVVPKFEYEATLYELLRCYAEHHARVHAEHLVIADSEVFSMDQAYQRLSSMLGAMPDWESLARFMPPGLRSGLMTRSAVATTLAAGLELVREGKLQLRQLEPFGPIYIRRSQEVR